MRVTTYKAQEGKFPVLVEPAVGKGLPPVVLNDVTVETLKERLAPALRQIRGEPAIEPPFSQ